MPFTKALSLLLMALLFLAGSKLHADPEAVKASIREGLTFFTDGQYEKAIASFKSADQDASATTEQKASALFWTAKSFMGLNKLDDAKKRIDLYLSGYPNGVDTAEALYQKGRLLYLQEDYEAAIQVLDGFLTKYTESAFVANAYFWTAESLFALGKLDEATEIYRKILKDHPSSFKVEAAQYRLSLIDLSRREVELAKLLKWSHEEFLRRSEEFQRREKTYEQAVEAFQKKLTAPEQEQFEKSIAELKAELEKKSAEALELSSSLQEAKAAAQVPAATPAETAAPAASTSIAEAEQALQKQKEELDRQLGLLSLKEQALDLKEQYLEWLEGNGGPQR